MADTVKPKEQVSVFHFNMDLFSPDERVRFQHLWAKVEGKTGREAWAGLSDSELYEFEGWVHLYDALERGDQGQATHYRKQLSMNAEQITAAFLALDLSRLPGDPNDPGPQLVENNCIYHFNRGGHRNLRINSIERGRIGFSTIQDMRRWLTFYETLTPSRTQ